MVAGFLILSYYVVIAGWALFYMLQMGSGALEGATADRFRVVQRVPRRSLADDHVADHLHGAHGLHHLQRRDQGLETAIRWFMPMLFVLLCVLLGYAVTSDGWSQGVEFMFRLDFSAVTAESVLIALGQAFFTLSLGMGAIMAYGAYLPGGSSIRLDGGHSLPCWIRGSGCGRSGHFPDRFR